MTWNHRVIRHVCKYFASEDAKLEIQEVYYGVDKDPRPSAREAEAAGDYHHGKPFMGGETTADLAETLGRMQRALTYPELECRCDATEASPADRVDGAYP